MRFLRWPTIVLFCGLGCWGAAAQTNSWTNSASGYWEDPDWSLGTLPGPGQSILFTNAGWKALAIGTNATQSFPQSLTIGSLTMASPTNSFNELLMNYAGTQVPLVIGDSNLLGSLVIESNSAVDMLSSALVVLNNGWGYPNLTGAFSIGGTFIESDGSQVTASFLDLGDIGPGTYDLTNSMLTVQNSAYVGGAFPAMFNQQGGTNATGDLVLQAGGEYDLYDGQFSAGAIEFQGGNFNQWGGSVSANLEYQFWLGHYHLAAGTFFPGNLSIPGIPPENLPQAASGFVLQTGGTNFAGTIMLGNNYGTGGYDLSNGVLTATSLDVGYYETLQSSIFPCVFTQSGGFHTNGEISIYGNYGQDYVVMRSSYVLNGGTLQTPSINLDMGAFSQTGGTNEVGDLSLDDVSSYGLSGGYLSAASVQLSGGEFFGQTGAFTQSGGTSQIGNLALTDSSSGVITGGQMTAETMQVSASSVFHHEGGALNLPGLLTLAGGIWDEQTGGQSFGALLLGAGSNSAISLPPSSCTLQFADSSSLAWSTNAALTIENWIGSLTGGGQQRIIFGQTAAALTAQQTSHIEFLNPADLASGTYPARILVSGEIVPDSSLPIVGLSAGTGRAPKLTLQGAIGQTYEIDVSQDLVHWVAWTNQYNATGAITITDPAAANCTMRFYRAIRVQ